MNSNLGSLPRRLFKNLVNLETLDLRDNEFKYLPAIAFVNQRNTTVIDLTSNPLSCYHTSWYPSLQYNAGLQPCQSQAVDQAFTVYLSLQDFNAVEEKFLQAVADAAMVVRTSVRLVKVLGKSSGTGRRLLGSGLSVTTEVTYDSAYSASPLTMEKLTEDVAANGLSSLLTAPPAPPSPPPSPKPSTQGSPAASLAASAYTSRGPAAVLLVLVCLLSSLTQSLAAS
ncbi:hypothetical protein GUITHDRAFT_102168 [Guillardia theta CCMP2712]|uniref:Uncharacterized protein n=1 Tax=Guillardia theta (strain CCMP2712) TaxID=905079 RepID=L1JUN4_GUITC|nr:hypothetical protein GUITHDRAFT_102168 [Guillardia theta CCMP2712]EKX52266.1 hypothetical protein GUITHDRAFT_102168 [Guillardia theta CCMP2712]|eukprot:XP_005839246.1 hypothetical protein GUITHDRAFT_102168 [Guillardia theta CCMP2712]